MFSHLNNDKHAFSWALGTSFLLAVLFSVLGGAILFSLGISFSSYWWGLYGVGAVLGARVIIKNRYSLFLGVLLAHTLILFMGAYSGSKIIDVGWDSVETHQRAVTLIEEGWNPIRTDPDWDFRQPKDGIVRSEPSLHSGWLDFNAMYVMAALYGLLPFGFEGAKGFHLSLVVLVLSLGCPILRQAGFNSIASGVLALFVCANPIFYYQWWTLYMDFDVAAYASLALVCIFSLSYRWSYRTAIIGFISLLLLALSKKAGLAFAIAFASVLALQLLVYGLRGKALWFRFGLPVGLILLMVVVAVVSGVTGKFGSSDQEAMPYGTEVLRQLVWEPDEFDRSLDLKVPRSIEGTTRPWQFFRSIFERTQMVRGGDLKWPLTWDQGQWNTVSIIQFPGFESGGFGLFFSGIFLLAVAARIVAPSTRQKGLGFRLLLYASILAICFVFPSWWARWVPFVWLLPCFLIAEVWFAYTQSPKSQTKWTITVGTGGGLSFLLVLLTLFLAIFNSGAIAVRQMERQLQTTKSIENIFQQFEETEAPVVVDFGRSVMVKRWFMDRGIPYQIADDSFTRGRSIPETSAYYWLENRSAPK